MYTKNEERSVVLLCSSIRMSIEHDDLSRNVALPSITASNESPVTITLVRVHQRHHFRFEHADIAHELPLVVLDDAQATVGLVNDRLAVQHAEREASAWREVERFVGVVVVRVQRHVGDLSRQIGLVDVVAGVRA